MEEILSTATVTSKDGTRIAYEQSGAGPALIMVDGAIQYRAIDPWGPQVAALLGQDFSVIRYDRRGRGESGDTLPYAAARELEDLEALIEAAGGLAYVFGMSSGAVLTLDAAACGLAITKLVVFEPPLIVESSRPPVPDDYVQRLTELAATGRRGEAVEYFLTRAANMPAEFVGPMKAEPFWPALEAVAHTIAYDGTFVADVMKGNPLPRQRWASISIPLLVVDSSGSPEWFHHGAMALVDLLPHAQCRTLEGQEHTVAPDVLAPVLREFFKS